MPVHPFFDAVSFPWERDEAKRLHEALYETSTNPDEIALYYKKAGGQTPLTIPQRPDLLWVQALKQLTAQQCLRNFCDVILADSRVRAVHAAVTAVCNAPPAMAPSGAGTPAEATPVPDWLTLHQYAEIKRPTGIAVEPDSGAMFVADHQQGLLVRILDREVHVFAGLNHPHHVLEVKGKIYVADTDNHRILCLDPTLTLQGIKDKFGKQKLNRPHGLASLPRS